MHLLAILAPLALLSLACLSTTLACLQSDFYYEQKNHQRLWGLIKDNGVGICGIVKQGAMRLDPDEESPWAVRPSNPTTGIDECEDLDCHDANWKGRICRVFGDKWHIELERKNAGDNGEEKWDVSAFDLKVDDKGNDERRLTEAVWGCAWEQTLHHKGIGFPNGEVHA